MRNRWSLTAVFLGLVFAAIVWCSGSRIGGGGRAQITRTNHSKTVGKAHRAAAQQQQQQQQQASAIPVEAEAAAATSGTFDSDTASSTSDSSEDSGLDEQEQLLEAHDGGSVGAPEPEVNWEEGGASEKALDAVDGAEGTAADQPQHDETLGDNDSTAATEQEAEWEEQQQQEEVEEMDHEQQQDQDSEPVPKVAHHDRQPSPAVGQGNPPQQQPAAQSTKAGQQAEKDDEEEEAGWQPGGQLRCAVINNRPWHLDVAAGLVWAFQAAGCNVTLYLPSKNVFGITDIMSGWFTGSYRTVEHLLNDAYQYDVFAMSTFPETHTSLLDKLMNLRLPGRSVLRRLTQRFLAVVHNPNVILRRKNPSTWARFVAMQPVKKTVWHDREQWPAYQARPLQFVTLAPFASTYLKELLHQWAYYTKGPVGTWEVPWMPPLAPWLPSFAAGAGGSGGGDAPTDVSGADGGIYSGSSSLRHLCIQGILDPRRRDYAAAFEALSHPAVLAKLKERKESLLLLGHVSSRRPLSIPPHLRPYAYNISGLPYKEYYDTLSRCRAILPAFASDVYLINKTSSTIATSINVGTPMVAESRVLKAYSFLSQEAVFTYRPPNGAASPDIAALADAEAHRFLYINVTETSEAGGDDDAGDDEEGEEWAQEGTKETAKSGTKQAAEEQAAKDDGDDQQVKAGGSAEAERRRSLLGGPGVVSPRLSRSRRLSAVQSPGTGSELPAWHVQPLLQQQEQRQGVRSWRLLEPGEQEERAGSGDSREEEEEEEKQEREGDDAKDWGEQGEAAEPPVKLSDSTSSTTSTGSSKSASSKADGSSSSDVELPEEGSYAHALLQLFAPGASSAAHEAARKLKRQLMEHNKQVAAQFLAEAVERAFSSAKKAELREKKQQARLQKKGDQREGEEEEEPPAAIAAGPGAEPEQDGWQEEEEQLMDGDMES